MAVATKTAIRKPFGKTEIGLTKSWSFKESLRALRRNFVSFPSQEIDDHNESDITQSSHVKFCSQDVTRCDVWRALSPQELPDAANFSLLPIEELSKNIFASITGPGSGLLAISKWPKVKLKNKDLLKTWRNIKNRKAHGLSVSLYEKNPLTDRLTGEPNADAFVVRARHNSAFMATADGVNWGRESMQAARCAIFAVYEYLETQLFGADSVKTGVWNTRDAAQLLFETLSSAQERIVSCTTGLTTLCVALILPVDERDSAKSSNHSSPFSSSSCSSSTSINAPSSSTTSPAHFKPESPKRFALIVVSVGDSQAFLLSKFHGIREVTGWVARPPSISTEAQSDLKDQPNLLTASPEMHKYSWSSGNQSKHQSPEASLSSSPPERDFRDAGGALGSVHKNGNPELHNLICAVTLCDPGDLVILGTDGLTDNFDPVITRIALPESPHLDFVDEQDESDSGQNTSNEPDHMDGGTNGAEPERFSVPARSWYTPLALSPPPQISIWPRPPPPPLQTTLSTPHTSPSKFTLAPDRPVRFVSDVRDLASPCGTSVGSTDVISARSLNFTNQLELNWAERRRYAGKEMERVWHETDAVTCSSGRGQASSRDLCEALIRHALNTTTSKRAVLQNPDFALLRVHPAIRLKLTEPTHKISEDNINAQRQWLTETLKRTPGKLDHATVVAYEVGVYRGDENEVYEETSHGLQVPRKLSPSSSLCDPSKHSIPS